MQCKCFGNEKIISSSFSVQNLTPIIIFKTQQERYKMWDHKLIQLIVEMLAHCTPPSCVTPNILSAAELLFVKELPSQRFVCSCCSVLLYMTKTLASYQVAKTDPYEQFFSDGTSH